MAELAPNYNIQCMKLFQELKSAFPCIPDMVVRQCMKQHSNDLERCREELNNEMRSSQQQSRRYKEYPSKKLCLRPQSLSPSPDDRWLSGATRVPRVPLDHILGHVTEPDSGHADTIPTVVLTPDSPPQQSPSVSRKIHTLYSPGDVDVQATVIESQDVFFPPESLEEELRKSLAKTSGDLDSENMIICGNNETVTKHCIDIVPGFGPISLPFGATTKSQGSDSASGIPDINLDEMEVSVTKSSTSVTQGKLHVVKNIGEGIVSIATTSFCSISHSVLSTANPNKRCKTVLYTINRKPIICENPFRKVFAKRKEFYQSRGARDNSSPETSSSRLIWRHSNHRCRRLASPPPRVEEPQPCPAISHQAQPQQNFFTLNANIEPFNPFTIKHDLSSGLDLNRNSASPLCSTVNLTLCPQDSRESSPPVEVLPDGSGLKYETRVAEEDGCEARLEVKVNLGGSTITTKRTGKTDITSNEISINLVPGGLSGGQVNIQQNQTRVERACVPPERPTSLHIPTRYASSRYAHSLYQGRGTSPQSLPRYNSLPSFKTLAQSAAHSCDYPSHPRDEEKRIAYTRALLSHQMEQLLKLKNELSEGRREVDGIKGDVRQMEQELKAQEMLLKSAPSKMVQVEVKQLENDIGQLRGACDDMSKRVTHLTAGKVPLGETSINFENYLAANQPSVPDPLVASAGPGVVTNLGPQAPRETNRGSVGSEGDKWACSECTFSNHPDLESCEMCEMPRFELGTDCPPRHSKDCFCNPRDIKPLIKISDQCEPVRPKVFTKPKYDRNSPKTNTTNTSSDK